MYRFQKAHTVHTIPAKMVPVQYFVTSRRKILFLLLSWTFCVLEATAMCVLGCCGGNLAIFLLHVSFPRVFLPFLSVKGWGLC